MSKHLVEITRKCSYEVEAEDMEMARSKASHIFLHGVPEPGDSNVNIVGMELNIQSQAFPTIIELQSIEKGG